MKMPVVLRSEAAIDLLVARDWYDQQSDGLGDLFSAQASAVFDRVGAMPELFALIARDIRACRLQRFPYVVYYRVLVDRVEVLAVLHGSRDPSAWRSLTSP